MSTRSSETYALFTPEMINPILSELKTRTRRPLALNSKAGWELCKTADGDVKFGRIISSHPRQGKWGAFICREIEPGSGKFEHDVIPSPYGTTGDSVWVRETWNALSSNGTASPYIPKSTENGCWTPIYKAGGNWEELVSNRGFRWRPSIHMPRWASRLDLLITDVKLEHLHDITQEEAKKEGVTPVRNFTKRAYEGLEPEFDYISSFKALWDKLYSDWSCNNLVWVYSFEVKKQKRGK